MSLLKNETSLSMVEKPIQLKVENVDDLLANIKHAEG